MHDDLIFLVNKEKGVTSRDVVNDLCRKFHTKRIGHTGTLDPLATGVLVVAMNEATKVVSLLTSTSKEYLATVEVGRLTDTLDTTGEATHRFHDMPAPACRPRFSKPNKENAGPTA